MNPTIDASAALKKLGITRPIKFETADLNEGSPEYAWTHLGGVTGAEAQYPDTVRVDWAGIRFNAKSGESKYADPAEVIAHELIHIKQFERFSTKADADGAYRLMSKLFGYSGNPYEQEAFEQAPTLAPLVKVNGWQR